jgi:hypothetical protein
MRIPENLFEPLPEQEDAFAELTRKTVGPHVAAPEIPSAATARLYGFDPNEQPLVVGMPGLPHQIVPARTTVALRRSDVGGCAVLLFEGADPLRPIIIGMVQNDETLHPTAEESSPPVSIQADDHRLLVSAEREIVLRCGDASITLTRAGKVLIQGTYVVSRSRGCNKIKGATVDIN